MPFGLSVALALAAQAAAPPTSAAPAPDASGITVRPDRGCPAPPPDPASGQIVICAPKQDGYRIDPDLLAARRGKKEALAGRPKPPSKLKDTSCTVVGPAPCIGAGAGINLLGAAATLAEMGARLSRGQEIGSMFVTDPQPSEYELYKEAKAEREAAEAEKKADAKAKAAASQPRPKPEDSEPPRK